MNRWIDFDVMDPGQYVQIICTENVGGCERIPEQVITFAVLTNRCIQLLRVGTYDYVPLDD